MKWIGQHIYDLIARFRSDVYLEDISTGTIASGGNLGLDSNNKIVKATEATGDITGVTITTDSGGGSAASDTGGSADFSILGATGVDVTNSGTTITAVAVPGEIDHDSLNNYAANEHFTQANITTVGTIGTGVWQGTTIKTAYIGDDQITGDKLDNTLLAEIEANTSKVTNVSTDLSQTTSSDSLRVGSSDGNDIIIAEASGSIAGVMTVAHHDKLDSIETNATADQTKSDIDGLAITTVGTIDTGTWQGTKVSSVYANTGGRRYGNTIKILPGDWMINDDAASPLSFKDGSNSGVMVNDSSSEMIALVTIPEGMKATALDIYSTNNKAVSIYELDLDSSFDFTGSGPGANETGNANTQITIDPAINATDKNVLAITYQATATSNRIWGGLLTIAPQ